MPQRGDCTEREIHQDRAMTQFQDQVFLIYFCGLKSGSYKGIRLVWEKVYHLIGQKGKSLFSVPLSAKVSDAAGEFNHRKSMSFRVDSSPQVLSLTGYVTTGNVTQMSASLKFLF